MMKKEQVLEALKNGNYEIKMEHECGCAIDWVIKHGELQPDISSDCCWMGKVLYIKNLETGITEPIFENVAYEPMRMINAEITKREFEDMLEENELLYILDKMSFDEDKETNYKHEDNLKESLLNYIEENEYTCYIRYPRNFANEYNCILVSKNAEKEDIPEDAEEITAEEFAERYLKKDTATTKYCIGFELID
jgi:hypothetical protein